MEMDKCKRIKIEEKCVVPINIRITKKLSKWIKEKKLSPTAIFNQACKELGA